MLPTLTTERLTLTPAAPDDLDALWALWTDADVRRFLWDDRAVTREEAAGVLDDCLAAAADGLGLWTVRAHGDDALAGCVGLLPANPPPGVGPLVALHPSRQHRGYAAEALRAVLGHAFATLRLPELVATVDVPNQASHRMVERLGFRRSGERQGPRYPMLLYTLPGPIGNPPGRSPL